ncbi:hypothetical protein EDC04DRAFT_2703886 [Pisolithus marmoratus]|nr:hypothetical protein EDC04DRAFT_2703886 [Pisolithus marmoratus]
MAPIGMLYGDIRQFQTKAILNAAIISGLEIGQPPFEFGVTNKSPEFTQNSLWEESPPLKIMKDSR